MAVERLFLLTSSITIWLGELVIYESVRNSRIAAFPMREMPIPRLPISQLPYSPGSPAAVPFAQTGIAISQFLMRIQ
jgi:hypothetical protein